MRFIRYITLLLILAIWIINPVVAQSETRNTDFLARDRIRVALASGATVLDLSELELVELPFQLWELKNLEILTLANNRLTTLPPDIGQLRKLQTLILFNNQLTTLPPEIGQLKDLRVLSLQDNQLTRLPAELTQLTNLESLFLNGNRLRNLPDGMGQLGALQEIGLDGNPLASPPSDIIAQGSPAILTYLQNQDRLRPVHKFMIALIVVAVILVLAIAMTFRKPANPDISNANAG